MEFSVAALLLAATLCRALPAPDHDYHWNRFKALHGKVYGGEQEEAARKAIFEANLRKIVLHNIEYDLGLHSFQLGLNKYADLSRHEISKYMNGLVMSYDHKNELFVTSNAMELPSSLDWRTKGYVTEVKDQGQCGSCWAFSTTGSLEGQHYRKTGKLVSLSEQNLIDCSGAEGNMGCDGGLMDQAFQYIIKNHGIDTEKSYPYTASDGTCEYNKTTIGATCQGYKDIPQGNEKALQQALATIGPISIAIDASHDSFQLYKAGVYDEPNCNNQVLDHGVLLVGYGTEHNMDYWLVKNSWGPSWGDQGYIKMARNKNNQCGIATQSSYPVV